MCSGNSHPGLFLHKNVEEREKAEVVQKLICAFSPNQELIALAKSPFPCYI
jgi:hypothetical protein